MRHLYKKLILSGIFAAATVGLLGTTTASAFSPSANIYDQPFWNRPQVAYNQAPEISLNTNDEVYPYWGYGGKGVKFVETTDYLKDENGNISEQLRSAQYGETIKYSIKFTAKKYIDDDPSKPATSYRYEVNMHGALHPDLSSARVTLDGQECPTSTCRNNSELSVLAGTITYADVNYGSNTLTQVIDKNEVEVEITFSAPLKGHVASDNTASVDLDYSYKDTTSGQITNIEQSAPVTATVRTGTILINKTDTAGKPLAGAKFVVDGTKATMIGGEYRYSPEYGERTEYTTDEYGQAVITGLPFGDYTVKEVAAPDGYIGDDAEYTVSVNAEKSSYNSYSHDDYSLLNADAAELSQSGFFYYMDPDNFIHEIPNGLRYYDYLEGQKNGAFPAGWGDITLWGYVDDISQISVGTNFEGSGGGWAGLFGWAQKDSQGKYTLNMRDSGGIYGCEMASDTAEGYYCIATPPAEWGSFTLTKTDDSTISVVMPMLYSGAKSFRLNSNTGYYVPTDTSDLGDEFKNMHIKESNGEFIFYLLQDESIFLTYKLNENTGKYEYAPTMTIGRIQEAENNTLSVSLGNEFWYDEKQDYYVWGSNLVQVALKKTSVNEQIFSTKLTVVNQPIGGESENTPSDESTPENVLNPQTSDAIFKALAIAAICLLPAILTQKRLQKR